MRGYLKLKDLDCSFYFDDADYILKLVVPESKINTRLFYDLTHSDLFDGVIFVEGKTLDNEGVRFYFDWINTRNLEIDLRVTYFIKFDQVNKVNFGHNVKDYPQGIIFSGDIIDALYSPKNALKVEMKETKSNRDGYVTDIKHEITDLEYSDFEKKGKFNFQNHECTFKFTVHKGFSSEDVNYFQSYKSILDIDFNDKLFFEFDTLIDFYSRLQRLYRFIFRISDFKFDVAKFRLFFSKAGFLHYGQISHRKPNNQGIINHRITFKKVFPVFSNLLSLFMNENIYLNHLSNNSSGYNFNDIPFLFSCFDNEFPKCYPEVDKRIDETYIKDRDKILVILEENSCNLQNTDKSVLNSLKQFLKNNELSFGKKLEYVLGESTYLHDLLGDDKKVNDFTKRIREFRNSLIHGRKFKYDKPIDFKELIIFEKMNYYLVVKRAGLIEAEIKDFISSIFFAFENNLMKKD